MSLQIPYNSSFRKKGFTLVELIVVILIIAILTTIAITTYNKVTAKAKENVLEANTTTMIDLISVYMYDYDRELWHGVWNDDGDGTLNNFLELELEIINSGTYENNISLINPYSDKMSILDYNQTMSSGDGYRPAVFMTANQSYSYAGTGSTDNLIGTIVAYFSVSGGETEYIEVFYVKEDGSKSDNSVTLGQEN